MPAARVLSTSRYFGDDVSWLGRYAVFQANADTGVQPVGTRKPNDFGLFDMLGNVSEWCHDSYRPVGTGALAPRVPMW